MASRRRRARRSPTTASSTTSASCGASSSGSGTASARAPTPRSCSRAYDEWGDALRRALQRHVRVRDLGPATAASSSSPATATAIKPLYYADAGDAFLFGSEIKSLLAHPRCPREARACRTCSSTSRSRTSSPTARCSRASGCCRPGTRADDLGATTARVRPSAYWDFDFREHDDGELRRGVRGGARPPVPPGRRAAARRRRAGRRVPERRHGLGLASPRSPRSSCRTCTTFTVGFDLTSASGLELGFDERAQGRGDVVPVQDRALRDGAQGRRHGALPAGARLAPRGPARRPELPELLRRAAREQVRQGRARRAPAATSCSPATRGATTAPSSTTTSTTTSRSTTRFWHRLSRTRVLPRVLPRRTSGARSRTCGRSTSSATRCPTRQRTASRPRSTSTTRSTSRRRRSCTGCCVVEDKLSMAHGLETRVPFLDNDLVDFAQRLPVRAEAPRPRARRAAQRERARRRRPSATSSSTRDGKLLLRQVMRALRPGRRHRPGQAGLLRARTRAGSAARASTTSDASCSTTTRAIYEFLEPRTVRRLVDDHLEGRENRRLLLWSLLNFEHWCRTFLQDGRPAEPAGALRGVGADAGGLTALRALRRFVSAVVAYATLAVLIVVAHVERRRPRREVPRVLWYVDPDARVAACARGRSATTRLPRRPARGGRRHRGRRSVSEAAGAGVREVPVGASELRHRRALARPVTPPRDAARVPRAAARAEGAAQGRRPAARLGGSPAEPRTRPALQARALDGAAGVRA